MEERSEYNGILFGGIMEDLLGVYGRPFGV